VYATPPAELRLLVESTDRNSAMTEGGGTMVSKNHFTYILNLTGLILPASILFSQ
jgi:hypothetical protein